MHYWIVVNGVRIFVLISFDIWNIRLAEMLDCEYDIRLTHTTNERNGRKRKIYLYRPPGALSSTEPLGFDLLKTFNFLFCYHHKSSSFILIIAMSILYIFWRSRGFLIKGNEFETGNGKAHYAPQSNLAIVTR